MKLQTFTTDFNTKILSPVKMLLLVFAAPNLPTFSLSQVVVRARLQNSQTGKMDEIIPSIDARTLADISARKEGFYIANDGIANALYKVPIMLNPDASVYLDNNKFIDLDVTFSGNAVVGGVLYGIEDFEQSKDFLVQYNKYFLIAGQTQQTFSPSDNEDLIIPSSVVDEVIFNLKNGGTAKYLSEELQAMSRLQNDINSVSSDTILTANPNDSMTLATGNNVFFDLALVRDFELRRASAVSTVTFYMLNRKA